MNNTPWFGISLGLIGVIVGSLVSTAFSPITSAEEAPVQVQAPAPTPTPAAPRANCG